MSIAVALRVPYYHDFINAVRTRDIAKLPQEPEVHGVPDGVTGSGERETGHAAERKG